MSESMSNGVGGPPGGSGSHASGHGGHGEHDGRGDARPPLVPSRVLAGKRLVVVGGTGFLGKVWVSMLLHRFPEVAHLYLLVRPKEGQSAEERFWSQIATSPVFDPLREMYPGEAFEAYLRDKVTPIAGDVVEPLLGIEPALIERLLGEIAAVVNVAGVVDFNPPLDEALEVNAFGVNNLVALARTLGARVMHTSTCYVAGYRSGFIEEVDPREIPFPRAEGETWYGASNPSRTLSKSHWDPQREIEECLDLIKQARHRCEDAFRQSAFLDEAKANLESRGEPCRGKPLDDEVSKVKRRFVERQLIEAGKERALFWGWSNIYTYTKSIGEQALAAAGVPFTIVRPAVIESSCTYPFPGWNEGINTSAPFLYMASKGQVQFPADHSCHLDIIPVDMVTSGMIASLAELIDGTAAPVYHYGSSDTNNCRMTRYMELAGLYKRRQVFEGKKTGIFDLVSSRFESVGFTKKEYEAHGARKIAGAMRGLHSVLDGMSHGALRPLLKPAAEALAGAAKAEDKTADILEIFLPFVAEADWVFSCANTRAAIARMPDDERARFIWTPENIDWRRWMFEVHLPGLEKWVYPLIEERLQKELKPLRPYDTLLDVLDEMAERHDHALALQRLERDGLTRLSYRELRAATFATAASLAAVGVRPGDRVILSGQNHPAWATAYFGILRAGAVAIPVDPGLEGPQLSNIVRSSGARVALWDAGVEAKGGAWAKETFPDLRAFDLRSFTEGGEAPGDSALAPPAFVAKSTDLASIIYTSGTTGDPKGVMLSHANFTALLASLAPVFPLKDTDRVLSVLPLHHTFEFTCGLLLPLSRGARVIYLDELNADRLGEGLQKGRITGMVGVPALWQLLERRILSRVKEKGPAAAMAFDWALDLNRMLGKRLGINAGRLFFGSVHDALGGHTRFLISGGAALPRDTAELFSGIGLPLAEGYGLTEAAPVLTVAAASVKAKPGTVGKPVPGVEIKIGSPDDRGVGEVLARGPNVMIGYAGNAEATAQAIDEEGWLHTGDLGKLDAKKRLVIVGRQKDVIVSASGENVYPDDVETLLGKLEGVKEIAIVGIDDGKGGERVACLAVPEGEPAADLSYDALPPPTRAERHERAMTALREAIQKLPRASQPAVTHLWDADLPRTATRKVKRNEVKAVLAKLASATEIVTTDGAGHAAGVGAVRHAVATIASKKPQELTAGLRLRADLGFDSLMTMELSVALEAVQGGAGAGLDAGRLAACETVAEVERLVGEGGAALAPEGIPRGRGGRGRAHRAAQGGAGRGQARDEHRADGLLRAGDEPARPRPRLHPAQPQHHRRLEPREPPRHGVREVRARRLRRGARLARRAGLLLRGQPAAPRLLREPDEPRRLRPQGRPAPGHPPGGRGARARAHRAHLPRGHALARREDPRVQAGHRPPRAQLRGRHPPRAPGRHARGAAQGRHGSGPARHHGAHRLAAHGERAQAAHRGDEVLGRVPQGGRADAAGGDHAARRGRARSLAHHQPRRAGLGEGAPARDPLPRAGDSLRGRERDHAHHLLLHPRRRERGQVDADGQPRRLQGADREARQRAGGLRAQDVGGDLHQDRPRGVHAEPDGVHDRRHQVERHLAAANLPEGLRSLMSSSSMLVTGATGFLGRHLVSQLRAAGHDVVALCRKDEPEIAALGATVRRGDVLDGPSVRAAAAGCEALFHCAGKVSRRPEDAEVLYRIHVEGTKTTLDACRVAGVRRVVLASTSGVVAVSEDPNDVRNEKAEAPMGLLSRWPYYRSKLYAERAALDRNGPGFEVVSVNPTLLLGPGDVNGSSTSDVASFLEKKLPFVPAGGLSFVDVRDAALAMILALERGRAGERYLVSAVNLTIEAFFARLERLTGVAPPRVHTPRSLLLARAGASLFERLGKHVPIDASLDRISAEMAQCFWYVDATKAKTELGWVPRDPGDTLADTIADLRERGVVWPLG